MKTPIYFDFEGADEQGRRLVIVRGINGLTQCFAGADDRELASTIALALAGRLANLKIEGRCLSPQMDWSTL